MLKNTFALLILIAFTAFTQTAIHSATLVWVDTQNPSGTTYSVYRASGLCSGSPVFSKLATAVTDKTYVDSTVQPGNYCYQATATFNGVESGPSNTSSGAVPAFSPIGLQVTVR